MKEGTKEDFKEYKDYCTVGNLKKFIKKYNVPDSAIVMIQRIEDVYYEKHGWDVYRKEGEHCDLIRNHNRLIDDGEIKGFNKSTEQDILNAREQYHPAWSPCLYKEDKNDFLFLDLHY